MSWCAVYIIAAFASGLYVGGTLMRWRWERNWMEPMRIESSGSLYKVHRCDDDRSWESWRNMELHRPEFDR